MTASFTSAATLDEAVAAIAAGARPVAGGTDLVVGARQGKTPLPDAIVAIDRIDALRRPRRRRRRPPARRARHARGRSWRATTVRSTVHRAGRRVGDRRVARDARQRHDRRQRDERVAGDGYRRSAALLRCHASRCGRRQASARCSLGELWTGPGATSCRSRRAARRRSTCRPRPPARVRPTCAWSTAARWRSRWSARPRWSPSPAARSATPASRSRRSRPTIRRVDRGRAGARRRRRRRCRRRRPPLAPPPPASAPISDVRASADYRTAMAEVVARRAIAGALTRAARRRRSASLRATRSTAREEHESMKTDATLHRERHRLSRSRSIRTSAC